MSTDIYPQEEGAVFDANSYILPCYPLGSISEVSAVALGTTTAGRISVEAADALGDGQGIALKAATGAGVPSRIPVLFYGVCKVSIKATETVTTGAMCMNHSTPTQFTFGASTGIMTTAIATLAITGGASYIMGMALQGGGGPAASRSDEILILVGKCI
jgi:hypothetical protein